LFSTRYTVLTRAGFRASQYVQVIEQREGINVGSIEDFAWRMEFVNTEPLKAYKAEDKPLFHNFSGSLRIRKRS